ncbi:DUF4926 domain-containing protein [Micromonospora sp. CPCC 206171]|uniref:DUF4926 domain-containing protein n=1 Tax=Micromonospora sp. CPCC 206171 TaxID=3122405 RepID=UPI002FEEBB82
MELYEVVELKAGLPEEGLAAGAVGSIVHVLRNPETAYEVEFTDEDGRTICTAALTPDRIGPAP